MGALAPKAPHATAKQLMITKICNSQTTNFKIFKSVKLCLWTKKNYILTLKDPLYLTFLGKGIPTIEIDNVTHTLLLHMSAPYPSNIYFATGSHCSLKLETKLTTTHCLIFQHCKLPTLRELLVPAEPEKFDFLFTEFSLN